MVAARAGQMAKRNIPNPKIDRIPIRIADPPEIDGQKRTKNLCAYDMHKQSIR
jgi:hypothetical protein